MGRLFAIALVCALWGAGASARADDDFVRVAHGQFELAGCPFRFVGANASVIHGGNERRDYERVLDAVREDGLSVVRIWALGEQPAPGKPYHPLYAFRIGEDGWIEDSFVQLDRVLVAAKARGLRVIVVLANRWKDYGGIGAYADWAQQPLPRDVHGEPNATQLSAFYDCAKCDRMYQAHVTRVVGRVNSVSGVAYRDDPTILAWELINEASAVTARDEETLLKWVETQSRFVRGLDARHLISAGHIGYGTTHERRIWARLQALPEIDFADAHAYPLHDPRVSTPARLKRWIDDRVAIAQGLGKPLLFGEFGFERVLGKKRVEWLKLFLSHAAKAGAAGALIWHYEPAANPRSSHSIHEDPSDAASMGARVALREAGKWFGGTGTTTRTSTSTSTSTTTTTTTTTTAKESQLPQPLFGYGESLGRGPAAGGTWVPSQGGEVLDLDPLAFSEARFERAGVYQEGVFDTLYGAGPGFVEYQFAAHGAVPRAIVIEARISSELPGYALVPDPRDGSDIQIELDGEVIATVRARPDDGLGEVVRVEWVDARSLRRFAKRRLHTLRLVALPSRYAGGLCLYGKPTGALPVAPEAKRDLDHVRIRLLR